MPASTHDGKVNFHSYIESGFDPLTCTFSANILLATLVDPAFEVRLCYSPLNLSDFGMGLGWRMPATVYNTENKLLSLADGRLFQVGDKFSIENGPDDIYFGKEKGQFTVHYRRTGVIERLAMIGDTHYCACIERCSAFGEALLFDWKTDLPGMPPRSIRLVRIYKKAPITVNLLTIETLDISNKKPYHVKIKVWPNSSDQRSFTLDISENALEKLHNESLEERLTWQFGYSDSLISATPVLSETTTPSGARESVEYETSLTAQMNLDFPRVYKYTTMEDSNLYIMRPLSSTVYQFKIPEHGNVKAIKRTFEDSLETETVEGTLYKDKNALVDLLHNKLNEVADPKRAQQPRDIIFNKLLLKRIIISGTVTKREFEHARISSKRTYQIDSDHKNHLHKLVHSHAATSTMQWKYNEFGDIVELIENKKKTSYEYLDPGAKTARLTNIRSTPDTENPSIYTETIFTYQSLGFKKSTDVGATETGKTQVPHYIAITKSANSETRLVEVAVLDQFSAEHLFINGTFFTYYITPAIKRTHSFTSSEGVVAQNTLDSTQALEKIIKNNKNDFHKQTTEYSYIFSPGISITHTKFCAGDLSTTSSITTSTFTGLTLREQDTEENVSEYSWDGLGRLTKTINNPKSEFETTEEYVHLIASEKGSAYFPTSPEGSARIASYLLHTDSTRKDTLSGYDSMSREVCVWEKSEDGAWRLVLEKKYQGSVLIESTTTDYIGNAKTAYTSSTLYPAPETRVDLRGNDKNQHYDVIVTETDEIKRSQTKLFYNTGIFEYAPVYSQGNASHRSLDRKDERPTGFRVPAPIVSGIRHIGWCEQQTFDTAGNILSHAVYQLKPDPSDNEKMLAELHSMSEKTYNERGLCISLKDANENTTRFEHDLHDRITKTHLPDNSIIEKTYAPHTNDPLITSIALSSKDSRFALGTQKFDELNRLTSATAVKTDTFTYRNGETAPSTIKSGTTSLNHTFIPQLGNVTKSITGEGLSHMYSYEKDTGLLSSFEDQTGFKSTLSYGVLTHLQKETVVPVKDAATKEQSRTFSPGGKCLTYTDASGITQTYGYDAHGNLTEIDDPAINIKASYGAFDRLESQHLLNKKDKTRLDITFTYNGLGEEIERLVTPDDDTTKTTRIQQRYHPNQQLAWRKTLQGDVIVREEKYTYSNRNLLTNYECTGTELPVDGYNKAFSKLELTYDALANITQCITHFGDEYDTATFHYENPDVACQLSRVTHTHKDYPTLIELEYDGNGCLTKNEKGQTLSYDALNRLQSLKDGKDTYLYHYDPQGRLRSRSKLTERTDWYYDLGASVPVRVSECKGTKTLRITRLAERIAALSHQDGKSCLFSVDRMGTPLVSYGLGNGPAPVKCTPFGITDAPLTTAWSGEYFDEISGSYHLGERQYSPVLMRFTTPDSWSPFAEGGINCYAYIDPVNCSDPSGHISFWGWLGIAAGVVLGVVLGVATAGAGLAAIYATGATIASVMMVAGGISIAAAGAVGIAAEIVRDSDPGTARTLDWVAFGLGVVGTIMTLGAGFARGAAQTALRGARSGAPRVGRMARYAVQEQTLGIEMQPLRTISRGGIEMQAEFAGGSRYAFSTASNMVSGVQSVASTVALEMLGRLVSSAPGRLIGATMGMEAMLGLVIGAKHHSERR